jgi:hypothetical protein
LPCRVSGNAIANGPKTCGNWPTRTDSGKDRCEESRADVAEDYLSTLLKDGQIYGEYLFAASKLKAKPDLAGKTVHCPKCGSAINVPNPMGKSSEDPPTTELTSVKKSDIPPATEKQKDYVRKLGITFPENVDRRTISSLVDQALGVGHYWGDG